MFSTKPNDIARFRETTNSRSTGVSTVVTFRCKSCKIDYTIAHRRRAGSHVKDGYVCVHCKDQLVRRAKLNSSVLAED